MIEEWNSLNNALQMLVKGFIYLLLCCSIAVLIRKKSSQSNKRIWHVGVIGILILSMMAVMPTLWDIKLSVLSDKQATTLENSNSTANSDQTLLSLEKNISNDDAVYQVTQQSDKVQWNASAILLTLWLCGVILLFTRWLLSVRKIRKLISSGKNVPHQVQTTFLKCYQSLSLKRNVRLISSPTCSTPFLYGSLHPVIVIPENSENWNKETQKAVFLHELEHLRAHDTVLLILINFAKILHWPNPLIWFGAISWRESAEHVADQAVVRSDISATAYAEILVRFAAEQSPRQLSLGLTMAHNACKIKQRVEHLLHGKNTNLKHKQMKILPTNILLTFSLFIGGLSFTTKAQDKEEAIKLKVAELLDIQANNLAPIKITSDDLFIDEEKNTLIYSGNVKITHSKYSLTCDGELKTIIKKATELRKNEALDIVATKNVTLIFKDENGNSVSAITNNLIIQNWAEVDNKTDKENSINSITIGKLILQGKGSSITTSNGQVKVTSDEGYIMFYENMNAADMYATEFSSY